MSPCPRKWQPTQHPRHASCCQLPLAIMLTEHAQSSSTTSISGAKGGADVGVAAAAGGRGGWGDACDGHEPVGSPLPGETDGRTDGRRKKSNTEVCRRLLLAPAASAKGRLCLWPCAMVAWRGGGGGGLGHTGCAACEAGGGIVEAAGLTEDAAATSGKPALPTSEAALGHEAAAAAAAAAAAVVLAAI